MLKFTITCLLFIFTFGTANAGDTIHHKMDITVNPTSHQLNATDTITIPASLAKDGMTLQLNSDLLVERISGTVSLEKVADGQDAKDIGIDRDNDKNPVVALREIAEETVPLSELGQSLIRGMQKFVDTDEPEENELMDLLSGSSGESFDVDDTTETVEDTELPSNVRFEDVDLSGED